MAFSSNSGNTTMANINVTPLVDVMLVLLIIFMITAPLMSQKVKVELPEAVVTTKTDDPARPITIAIKENGDVFYNDEPVTPELLESRLSTAAQLTPQPPVDIRADRTTRYRIISDVITTVRLQGIRTVGFVASPEK
ncbi:ExbD/TolR family protein [Coralloluteibacterium stylophorae]|uniref:Biopolymer transporter ExbD n=1 Tax=Coralloluteibacterium stylophorae TaxID=1776034 RepID=A0A8J8AY02_9GAMM|nr:biopolymer transporter ExbD [Coralloluteibacterium stylophorae]MBS7458950.1 biopolymer transporter ExbD [Coralloluteibacterium stylophorae]